MNATMRRMHIERDARECVHCHGSCPFLNGEKCNLPAKTLSAAAYWRLDGLRSPMGRLQVHHAYGKSHEGWDECATVCPCCHAKCTQGGGAVQESVLAHLATVGPEPEAYRIAREQEAAEKPVRKAARKVKARAYRKAQKARVQRKLQGKADAVKKTEKSLQRGRKPTAARPTTRKPRSKISQKDADQRARPNFNTFRTP